MLFVFSFISFGINAQININEGFESGMLNPSISFQSTGSFSSSPGIINNTNFGSTKAFSFGKSTCSSSCFDNYKTTLIITFPSPALVNSINWKEMEIGGNWGSQGQILLDDVVYSGATLGAMPVNSGVPDATPQLKNISINQTATTIKFVVNDITNASEIILDDLLIEYNLIPKITGYEYWFNNDYVSKTITNLAPTQQLMINQTVPTTGLMQGINTINFRSFDNSRKYSSVISHFFYKTSVTESNPAPEIVAYEYWIDNDYANAVVVNTPVQQQLNINELMSMTTLNNGVHNFNIRFKDNSGMWSSVLSHLFYKIPEQNPNSENKMISYRYWFNDDFNQATNVTLSTPNSILNISDNLSLTQLHVGQHTIHFQFKDSNGMWSLVSSDIIDKTIMLNITENELNSKILIYPNPTNGKVQVDLKETHKDVNVLIHDINGRLVRQTSYKNQQTLEFNFNEPSGTYLITIISEKKRTTIRLIKN